MDFQFTPQYYYKQPSYGNGTVFNSDNYQLNSRGALEDVPRYPNTVNNMAYRSTGSLGYEDAYDDDGAIFIEHHQVHHVPEARHHHPRARFAESVEMPARERNPAKVMVRKEKPSDGVIRSVDDEADGFIKANHRDFELRQWRTFKM